jgi:hypothetical protein
LLKQEKFCKDKITVHVSAYVKPKYSQNLSGGIYNNHWFKKPLPIFVPFPNSGVFVLQG